MRSTEQLIRRVIPATAAVLALGWAASGCAVGIEIAKHTQPSASPRPDMPQRPVTFKVLDSWDEGIRPAGEFFGMDLETTSETGWDLPYSVSAMCVTDLDKYSLDDPDFGKHKTDLSVDVFITGEPWHGILEFETAEHPLCEGGNKKLTKRDVPAVLDEVIAHF